MKYQFQFLYLNHMNDKTLVFIEDNFIKNKSSTINLLNYIFYNYFLTCV